MSAGLVWAAAWAASSSMAAAAPPIAIVHATVEVGDGTTVKDATVVVDKGLIQSVAQGGAAPAGAEVVDAAGRTLTPGLIHVGSQVGLVEVSLERSTVDTGIGPVAPAFRAVDGWNPRSPRVAIDRKQGVTSIVAAPQGALLAGTGYLIELSGKLDSTSRAQRAAMFGGFGTAARDAAGGARGGVLLKLREIFDDVRFFKANRGAYDRAGARALSLPRVHLEALIDVVDGKLPVVFDVNRAADIRALLAFAQEQRIKVVVNGGAEAWLVADELARARVPVIVQPDLGEPWSFEALGARDDIAAALERAGVDVILTPGGTDLGTTRVRQEAGVAVAFGMSRAGALRAVTSTPARVLGTADRGLVQAGKRADLVLWSGDPFEVTTVADAVFIGGERASLDTRQDELARRWRR